MRRLLWLLLIVPCFGQTQGNLPQLIDSVTSGTLAQPGDGTVNYPESVSTGQTLVVCAETDTGGAYSILSALGNTVTQMADVTTPAPHATRKIFMALIPITVAGSETLSFSGGTFKRMLVGRFANVGAMDGSAASNTLVGTTGNYANLSTSNTTTTNGDILVSCGGTADFGGPTIDYGPASEAVGHQPDVNSISILETTRAPSIGANTATLVTKSDNNNAYAMQTIALKPTTIAIVDTALPQAATSVAYKATLHGVGGTAALTCSIVSGSLPTGLSLSGTGNCDITGTPSGTTQTVGFQVTDGTLTSATNTLTLTVGSSLGNPQIRQTKTINWDSAGPITITAANCGSVIVIFVRGDDTHGTTGWVQAVNGTSNKITTSPSYPVQRIVGPIPGQPGWPLVTYVIGPLTASGNVTITAANNQSASSGRLTSIAVEVSGVQAVVDYGGFSNDFTSTSTGTTTASYTTPVPNTFLLAAISTDNNSPTASLSAPFSTFSSDSDIQGYTTYASAAIAAASTVTATNSFTGGTGTRWSTLLVPLRPGVPLAACNTFSGAGEQIGPQVW